MSRKTPSCRHSPGGHPKVLVPCLTSPLPSVVITAGTLQVVDTLQEDPPKVFVPCFVNPLPSAIVTFLAGIISSLPNTNTPDSVRLNKLALAGPACVTILTSAEVLQEAVSNPAVTSGHYGLPA